ncbi:MAG TPA: response regulator [Anaerolineae bacterium]
MTDTTRILVVEDESIVAMDIKSQLKRLGYDVPAMASSADSAIEKALEHRPDLVLMDIKLKGEKDGITAADYIRTHFDIPVIYLTAYADEATLQRAKITEPYGYLLKPFEERELHTTIEMGLYRHRMERKLKENERWLTTTLQSIGDGIIAVDAQRRIRLLNPVAQSYLLKLTKANIGDIVTQLGQYPLEELLKPPPDGHHCHELILGGPPHQIFEIITQSIETDPETGGWVLLVRDVTRERTAQELIQQQEKLAAVGQLAAGIAHDFNNILTGIIGFAELTTMHFDIPKQARDNLEFITQQGQRAAHLIRQILDFSRKSITEKRTVDLASLVDETIALLKRTIPESIKITLEIESSSEAYLLKADSAQLQQALTNLAANARDAMPAGGQLDFRLSTMTLETDYSAPYLDLPAGEWLGLSISDSGTGIAPDILSHIFEPFFTTKMPGKGTGLELAQVYGIVKQHDGYLNVESQVGLGTTFTIYLPKLPLPHQGSTDPESTQAPNGSSKTLLLVEDEPSVLEVVQLMLEQLGYRVLTAMQGQEALGIYDQHQDEIALVLTDMTMPELSGLALVQALRDRNPAVKIVLMTGYPLETDGKEALEQDSIIWLQKPLTFAELGQTINELLNSSSPTSSDFHHVERPTPKVGVEANDPEDQGQVS